MSAIALWRGGVVSRKTLEFVKNPFGCEKKVHVSHPVSTTDKVERLSLVTKVQERRDASMSRTQLRTTNKTPTSTAKNRQQTLLDSMTDLRKAKHKQDVQRKQMSACEH
jgi:hypothetical protein